MSRSSLAAFFICSFALPSVVIGLNLHPLEGDRSGLQTALKEFWKSVNICWRCGQKLVAYFFGLCENRDRKHAYY